MTGSPIQRLGSYHADLGMITMLTDRAIWRVFVSGKDPFQFESRSIGGDCRRGADASTALTRCKRRMMRIAAALN